MGGTSKSTTTQNSTTAPWEPAQGALTGILGQLNSFLPQTGITGAQTNALNTIEQNGASTGQYAPAIQDYVKSLLGGGNATAQSGAVGQNFADYKNAVQPLASNTNYDPYSTPGFSDAISTLKNDITSSTNGRFAAAGRDFSGANSQALGRGIMQGIAPTIAAQYNANVQNQQGAAGNLYNAGNTTAGLQTGMTQQGLANQGVGLSSVGTGLDALNLGANATLAAEAQRLGIPLGNLAQIAQLGIPIAGLGSQSQGTSNTENQMSGAQQFATIMGGFGQLMPKGPISFGGK
jgi:hypothetical protein